MRFATPSIDLRPFACASFAALVAAGPSPAAPATVPPWMTLRAGTVARVDLAPWLASDEPEAALAASAASVRRDFTADAVRPSDVVYEPVGVRVRVLRMLAGGVALVHGATGRWEAYAPTARLVPDVPLGTHLRIAGGFDGATDFFPALATPVAKARSIESGSDVVAGGMAAAPYDPQTADLVRVRVRVTSGALRGRTGYVAVAYTGVPGAVAHPSITERACACRLTVFDDAR